MRIATFILCIVFAVKSHAQDIHFSQFGRSYLTLNPALTGSFNANYRFNANYKNQWSSISEPYRTFSFGAEAKSLIKGLKNVHFGVLLYNDEAGIGGLNTSQAMLSIAYSTGINYDSTIVLKGGIQGGILSRSINFNNFSFDQQFDGNQFVPNSASGENFDRDSYTNPSLNFGLALQYNIRGGNTVEAGFGLFNLLGNNQSFQGSNIPLELRATTFARADITIGKGIDLLPAVLFSKQAKYKEVVFGSNLRYRMKGNHISNENIYLGLWYRNQDAIIASVAFDYRLWQIGLSYDINTSGLETASNHKGGIELSLTYLIKTFRPNIKRYIKCPDFL